MISLASNGIKAALAAARATRTASQAARVASAASRAPAAVAAQRFAGMGPLQQIMKVAKPESLAQFAKDSIPDALFAGVTGLSMLAQGANPLEAAIGAVSDYGTNATLGNIGGKALGAAAGRAAGAGKNARELQQQMENYGNMGMFAGNMVVPFAVPNPGFNMMNERMTQDVQAQQQQLEETLRRQATPSNSFVDAAGNIDYNRLLYSLGDDALQAVY